MPARHVLTKEHVLIQSLVSCAIAIADFQASTALLDNLSIKVSLSSFDDVTKAFYKHCLSGWVGFNDLGLLQNIST